MSNPWDDVELVPSQLDFCACGHPRSVHSSTSTLSRCWSCHHSHWAIGIGPVFPDHAFHLTHPWNVPVQTPRGIERYRPEPGWDRPSMSPRQ